MKILVLSNLYPPHHIGGYEMLCQEVTDGLAERGHTMMVLTSDFDASHSGSTAGIERTLRLESDIYHYRRQQVLHYWSDRDWNRKRLRTAVASFQPDVVSVWGMWNLSKDVAQEVERLMGDRVVYYLANAWPIEPSIHRVYWDAAESSWRGRLFKLIAGPIIRRLLYRDWRLPQLRFTNALCCSVALRKQIIHGGIALTDAPIVYEGIHLDDFRGRAQERWNRSVSGQLNLIFVGTLVAHKGAHTAIESIAILKRQGQLSGIHLTILGKGHPDYEEFLHKLVEIHGLSDVITFHSPIQRSELPDFLARFDALLMPSVWQEPLARIMQDAMASGLPLVATPTGGTSEIVVDGINGLLFPPEDANDLADCISRLAIDPGLCVRLGKSGVQTADEKFDLERMISAFEKHLERAISMP